MKLVFLVLMIGLNAACASSPEVVEPATGNNSSDVSHIFISNHGWHTGVIIRSSELTGMIPELGVRFVDSDYLEIGWGDAGFYQAKDITLGLVIQALLWPTEAVVHVVGFSGSPKNYFAASNLNPLSVNENNMRTLASFIRASFALSDVGEPLSLQPGVYGDSQFYKGVGSYYLMNTCNTWTAKALYSAGIDINPRFKLTASGITKFLNNLEQ